MKKVNVNSSVSCADLAIQNRLRNHIFWVWRALNNSDCYCFLWMLALHVHYKPSKAKAMWFYFSVFLSLRARYPNTDPQWLHCLAKLQIRQHLFKRLCSLAGELHIGTQKADRKTIPTEQEWNLEGLSWQSWEKKYTLTRCTDDGLHNSHIPLALWLYICSAHSVDGLHIKVPLHLFLPSSCFVICDPGFSFPLL